MNETVPEGVIVCIDCTSNGQWDGIAHECSIYGVDDHVCRHWTPEYWTAKRYRRNWSEASLHGSVDGMEMLRKEDYQRDAERASTVEYILLAPRLLRRPAMYYADGPDVRSWGRY